MDSTPPLVVVLKLLAIIFIAEAGVMLTLPAILPASVDPGVAAFVDSCLLTLLTAPLIWWVIIGPLRAAAAHDKLAAVSQMAAGVAHELRNPLTSVKMLVQSHRESPALKPQMAEDFAIIEDEVRRMERSLQAFLDFARPRDPERRPLDPAEVVQQVYSLIRPRARNQGVALELDAPEGPCTIRADWEQLFQAVLNLCNNGLDAMPDGGALTIRLDRCDGALRIVVQDTGRGIDPEILPRLSQPFVTNKETGTGLGLVMCQRFATLHDGKLWGENLRVGACFTLELPVA